MSGSRLARYFGRWRAHRPQGLVSPSLRKPGSSAALRVHRRVLGGVDQGPLPWLAAPVQAWTATRWWTHDRRTIDGMPNEVILSRYAKAMGARVDTQESRLRALRRQHGIPPLDALCFGLTLDGHSDDWPDYVYSVETGWNISASAVVLGSARQARRDADKLADKNTTAAILAAQGLPVVPSWSVDNPAALETAIAKGLGEWDGVFVKPRRGSSGFGAAIVRRTAQGTEMVTYGRGKHGLPITPLELAKRGPLLIQPLLRSPDWSVAAGTHDIATLRIATRNHGHGPEVFSQVLELPLAEGYSLRAVRDGTVGPDLFEPFASPDHVDIPLAVDLAGIDPSLGRAAIVAHEQFPGLFAAAWDIALTADGPVFLEGNAGFGTRPPQMASAGLLQDL